MMQGPACRSRPLSVGSVSVAVFPSAPFIDMDLFGGASRAGSDVMRLFSNHHPSYGNSCRINNTRLDTILLQDVHISSDKYEYRFTIQLPINCSFSHKSDTP